MNSLYSRRLMINRIALVLAMSAMVFGLAFLTWILVVLIAKGIGGINLAVFTQMTPAPGSEGGLVNAIYGSFIMVGVATFVATPIGIMAGIYLAEFGKRGWVGPTTRFVNDILLSAPSIILGLFVYAVIVANAKHFSGWAGSVALALIAIPVVVRTTESMLNLVPSTLREAAAALGAPQWKVIVIVALRAVKGGVITGVMLAVARISGETAPLLFWSADMNAPMANLPVAIYQFALSPFENWVDLAWVGALLITFSVLALNILARAFFDQRQKT
jgi:phosphate transport system permease protein